MVLGFTRVGTLSVASVVALLIGAGIPAGIGITLLTGSRRHAGALTARQVELRRHTLESEVLRLAATRAGKLTLIEVVTELAVPSDEASEILDSFMTRGLAELQVTDSGALVYDFRDVRLLGEKNDATDVLDG